MCPDIPASAAVCTSTQLWLLAEYVLESTRRDIIERVRCGDMDITDAARLIAGAKPPVVSAVDQFKAFWSSLTAAEQAEVRAVAPNVMGLPDKPPAPGVLFPEAVETKPEPKRTTPTDAEFEEFWQAYPRRVRKPKAKEAFQKAFAILCKEHTADEAFCLIMKGVTVYAANADPDYLCHPATWLNSGAWGDEPEAISPQTRKAKTASSYGAYDPAMEGLPW